MKRWYPIVYHAGPENDADLMKALDAADAYDAEYELAKRDLNAWGKLEHVAARLSGVNEQRFSELQDLNAIIEHLENREMRVRVDRTRHYLEHYQRTVSDRVAREYAEASDEVQLVRSVIQRVAYVHCLYQGIIKGLATQEFQVTNITKLRVAGLEDAEIVQPR